MFSVQQWCKNVLCAMLQDKHLLWRSPKFDIASDLHSLLDTVAQLHPSLLRMEGPGAAGSNMHMQGMMAGCHCFDLASLKWRSGDYGRYVDPMFEWKAAYA